MKTAILNGKLLLITTKMSYRNLVILTKIILFYSLFFIFMKGVILFQGAWVIPNLVLMVPFIILSLIAGWQVKQKKYSWIFVGVGVIVIILTRIYERDLALWIHYNG